MTGPLQGETVLVVGRGALADAYAGEPGIRTETVDLTDNASIADLGERVDSVHHVVPTASARARGRLSDLNRDAVRVAFDTKVIGPLMLAHHLGPGIGVGGSFTLFSGVVADVLARSLAPEMTPVRVNAISPGVIDTGAWDALGEQRKADYFADAGARNPARRIGTAHDVADAVLFAMTSTFLTGGTLRIDGGEPLT